MHRFLVLLNCSPTDSALLDPVNDLRVFPNLGSYLTGTLNVSRRVSQISHRSDQRKACVFIGGHDSKLKISAANS